MNKKGVVFTFIAVTLLAVIIIAFLTNINHRNQTKIQTNNVKVETLNSFVKNLNSNYLSNILEVSSHQAMFSLLDYEANNSYVIDIEGYFRQVLNDGKYNSVKQEDMFQNNLDYSLINVLNEIKSLANQQGAIFDYFY